MVPYPVDEMVKTSRTPLFIRIARPTYGKLLLRSHRVNAVGLDALTALSPPYVLLSNHVHAMDPFIISSASPVHIRWVAGAYLFRLFGLRPLLERWVGAISKMQDKSDMHTLRQIRSALGAGDIVGIFPEGTRSWDGEPLEFTLAMAKMLKRFDVPVVILNLEGLYGHKPRWARKSRRGTSVVRWVETIDTESLREMDVPTLHERLLSAVQFSYRDWQAQERSPFISRYSAEGIEQILYLCPSCHAVGTILGSYATIHCTACSLQIRIDPYQELHIEAGECSVTDLNSWRLWQHSRLVEHFGSIDFPADTGIFLQMIEGYRLRTKLRFFSLHLTAEGILAIGSDTSELLLPFSEITSIVINARSTLELSCQGVRYRIRIQQNSSTVKYIEYTYAFREQGGSS